MSDRRSLLIALACVLPAWAAAASTPAPMSATRAQAMNAEAKAENQLIAQVNAAMAAKDWAKAESSLQQLVKMAPEHWQYLKSLADAEFGEGKYEEAVKSYAAALVKAEKEKLSPAIKEALAAMYTNQGNAYLKQKQTDKAIAAYEKAAAIDPHPATAYFNICATMYNAGNADGALKACDQALAADPNKADAWFIKGSLLMGNSSVDAKGKTAAPPGTVEALQKYLQLAPTGPHADDVKQMLDYLGVKPGG
ncbi:MAG: tetratricopeptide repeat protein [Bacillota bacterium]